MTSNSDPDFRSERVRLPKESFLIAPDEDPEPSDLIDKDTSRTPRGLMRNSAGVRPCRLSDSDRMAEIAALAQGVLAG